MLDAADDKQADVVVIVDTSTSMSQPGMDPQRTSLLVTKLFADIVPGDLAVVRLLDLSKDSNLVPSRKTGQQVSCSEDPTQTCDRVEALRDWYADARANRFGSLVRGSLGDRAFKEQLDNHLKQNIHNSLFGLALRASQGIFDTHAGSAAPRTIVWLSDGTSDDPGQMRPVIDELRNAGVTIEPLVMGNGITKLQRDLGLTSRQVRSSAELMKVFADTFRGIMRAPYKQDGLIAANPTFEVKPKVDEAWVVVYGDDTLGEVSVDTPQGVLHADYAQDRLAHTGAYRVLHVAQPAAGKWTLRVNGGGAGAAYAVIQRSALIPLLLEPHDATAGVPVAAVAALATQRSGPILTGSDISEPTTIDVTFDGSTYRLADDGTNGDPVAGDGRFTGMVTFNNVGDTVVVVHAKNSLLDKTVKETVHVSGSFHYHGGPLTIDLGGITAGQEACSEFTIQGEHQGQVPFKAKLLHSLPARHRLELRTPSETGLVDGAPIHVGPGQPVRVCLVTTRRAPSSEAMGEPTLELEVPNSTASDARVRLDLRWNVHALSWWELYGNLFLFILGILALLVWIYGYIRPIRFMRSIALVFVPEEDDLDEQSPQPLAQWRGVGIGWYRDARAYLLPSFRVSGKPRGALASLHAVPGGTQARPSPSHTLYRRTSDLEWEQVSPSGCRASSGQVFRVSDAGPFFKVMVRWR
jgi:hypothetical protein